MYNEMAGLKNEQNSFSTLMYLIKYNTQQEQVK